MKFLLPKSSHSTIQHNHKIYKRWNDYRSILNILSRVKEKDLEYATQFLLRPNRIQNLICYICCLMDLDIFS